MGTTMKVNNRYVLKSLCFIREFVRNIIFRVELPGGGCVVALYDDEVKGWITDTSLTCEKYRVVNETMERYDWRQKVYQFFMKMVNVV